MDSSESLQFVSYADFGREFFATAVTTERLLGAVDVLAGQPIEFGPTGVGPGRLVKVIARGSIGAATGKRLAGDDVSYRVTLPVALEFEVDLGLETHRFKAELKVPLVLTARAVAGLQVYLDVTPPTGRDVQVKLQAQGLRASVLQRVAGVEGEVRRFVAKYVARELDKPHIRDARLVDVAGAIDAAWASLQPSQPARTQTEHRVDEDLEEAIEAESWNQEAEGVDEDHEASA